LKSATLRVTTMRLCGRAAVRPCGRGDHRVLEQGVGFPVREFSPLTERGSIHRQHVVRGGDLLKPLLDLGCLGGGESVSPILSVDDLAKSLDFYCHTLGFDLAWSWGDPPDIAAVCRDGFEITLTQRAGARPAGAAHVYLGVSGMDDYHVALVDAGVTMVVPIGDRPYGMRDFRIADPSGNEISIGQAIAGAGGA